MTETKLTESPVCDPLEHSVALPLRGVFYPLGFPLELSTNSNHVLEAAQEAWGSFQQMFSQPPMQVRIAVGEDRMVPVPETCAHRAQAHLAAIVSDRHNFAFCDLERAFAFGWFSPATVEAHSWFRLYFLEKIANLILWQLHLTPLHAACVARDGRGVLLCGESDAGKSTLAFACMRKGWTFIGDDATTLLRNSPDRMVLANPGHIRFREDAPQIFPELRGRHAQLRIPGKMTIEVCIQDLPGVSAACRCHAGAVIFLNRQAGGPARLLPIPKDEALGRLLNAVALYPKEIHEQHTASLENLLQAGAFQLDYRDLDAAVEQLELLMRAG